MIFAAILAGGVGNRMGEVDKPKQFLTLGDKPILIQTVEKFYLNHRIDEVIVLCHKYWINHTKDLIDEYIPNADNVTVVEGGELRNDTIMNAVSYIEGKYDLSEDDIIITHDSVRPFVTHRIIMENILLNDQEAERALEMEYNITGCLLMDTERTLRIGDMSDNGQVTIVDEDRLCYLVKSVSKGATGLRTISKPLL